MILENIHSYPLTEFDIETLVVESAALKSNPLGDSNIKYNLVLKPKNYESNQKYSLVMVLAGFTGNSGKYFNYKSFEQNYPQSVDQWYKSNPKVNRPIFVFVDAMTFVGGGQFINSERIGNYENYIVNELKKEIDQNYSIKESSGNVCLVGGSSGGYGALHLASKYPDVFGRLAAIAPDSDFVTSLLPELYQALPLIERWGGVEAIFTELKEGRFFKRKHSHTVLNVIAMAMCYSKGLSLSIESLFPFDTRAGEIVDSGWQKWLENDPIHFLPKRLEGISSLSGVFLEVGMYDQFNLQYGSRKIHRIFKDNKIVHHYFEFKGTHFDLSTRRPGIWNWLSEQWS